MSRKARVEHASSERIDPIQEGFGSFGKTESGDGDHEKLWENEEVREVIGEDLLLGVVQTCKQIEIATGLLDNAMREHPESAALLKLQWDALKW